MRWWRGEIALPDGEMEKHDVEVWNYLRNRTPPPDPDAARRRARAEWVRRRQRWTCVTKIIRGVPVTGRVWHNKYPA